MLTPLSLPPRSLTYHWTSAVPVLLGVAVGAAVLTGALIVGDSLRGSLRARTERQLNGLQSVYLSTQLVPGTDLNGNGQSFPALLLSGSARSNAPSVGNPLLAHATVIGLSDGDRTRFEMPKGVVIGTQLASDLRLAAGGEITLGLERGSRVPRSSLLGKRDAEDVTANLRFPVAAVLPADHPMNDFALTPTPGAPRNVFVPLGELQKRLDLPKVNASLSFVPDDPPESYAVSHSGRPDPLARFGLRRQGEQYTALGGNDPRGLPPRQQALRRNKYTGIESENGILDAATVRVIEETAYALGVRSERTLAYLANAVYPGTDRIRYDDKAVKTPLMAYAIVAAVNPTAPAPLGPFLPPGVAELKDDEIALLDWPDQPLMGLKPGDPVSIAYFKPEMEAQLDEAWHTFRFAGYLPLTGPADDPNLTPPFPGITDKPKIRNWQAPFDINYDRIGKGDDEFWEQHEATPKAYVNRATGERLFGSRFGAATSVRLDLGTVPWLTFRDELVNRLTESGVGPKFEPVTGRLAAASQGGTDFGAMLLAFSVFLIGAALLLVGLLFRLSIDRRAKEVGLLLATGYSPRQVLRLLLIEGGLLAVVGSLVGGGLAVGYAKLMIGVLAALWPDAQVQSYLTLHVTALSLLVGFVLTVLVSVAAVWLGVRGLVKVPPPALLRGETKEPELTAKPASPKRNIVIGIVCAVVGVGTVFAGTAATNPDERAGTFFGGGLLLLAGGAFLFRGWLVRSPAGLVSSVSLLGTRNTTRAATRSLLTVCLIAVATFLLVAVESFRKRPGAEFAAETGGSGGFRLMGETDVPVFHRLDSDRGRADMLDELQKVYQDGTGDVAAQKRAAEHDLKKLTVFPFRLRGGDDASCLSLYQAVRPRVLGVPDELLTKRRFAFAMTEASTPEEKANPWLLLAKPRDDGATPVIVEMNTALWMLKTFLGGTVTTTDETGREVKLRIVGLLQDSVFQSELLVSDANFKRLYPREEGFRVFLIDAPANQLDGTAGLLETGLRANGMTVTRTADRVATYQAVIGAYLSTFQLLGGLGLLLGLFGLAAVMLRAVWERTGELALLRAVGYRVSDLQRLILVENVVLLAVGVGIGLTAAVISVIPNLVLGGQIGSARLWLMLAAVVAVGLLVAVLTTRSVARVPLISALRKE